MQPAAIPITTTCNRPNLDRQLTQLIRELVGGGLTVRQATEAAARRAAAAAVSKRWPGDLVDFVVIRTVDLGARYAAQQAAHAA